MNNVDQIIDLARELGAETLAAKLLEAEAALRRAAHDRDISMHKRAELEQELERERARWASLVAWLTPHCACAGRAVIAKVAALSKETPCAGE
jgi:hypothetical protein